MTAPTPQECPAYSTHPLGDHSPIPPSRLGRDAKLPRLGAQKTQIRTGLGKAEEVENPERPVGCASMWVPLSRAWGSGISQKQTREPTPGSRCSSAHSLFPLSWHAPHRGAPARPGNVDMPHPQRPSLTHSLSQQGFICICRRPISQAEAIHVLAM